MWPRNARVPGLCWPWLTVRRRKPLPSPRFPSVMIAWRLGATAGERRKRAERRAAQAVQRRSSGPYSFFLEAHRVHTRGSAVSVPILRSGRARHSAACLCSDAQRPSGACPRQMRRSGTRRCEERVHSQQSQDKDISKRPSFCPDAGSRHRLAKTRKCAGPDNCIPAIVLRTACHIQHERRPM